MIRQRVDRHGNISQLEPESELAGCTLPVSEIGVIKEGPVKKWIAAKRRWDTKFASSKRKVQKHRAKEMALGYHQFGDGEVPPPSALAGRRKLGEDLTEAKKTRSMGMTLWAVWGSKHDKKTIVLEQEADKTAETTTVTEADGANARPLDDVKTAQGRRLDAAHGTDKSRSRSRRRTVTDQHQTEGDLIDENTPAAVIYNRLSGKRSIVASEDTNITPEFVTSPNTPQILVRSPTVDKDESELKRPKAGGIAFPFSLKSHGATASMTTLTSSVGVQPVEDIRTPGSKSGNDGQQNVDGAEPSVVVNGQEEGEDQKSLQQSGTISPDMEGAIVVGIGEVANPDRPHVDRFFSAQEVLPPQSTTGN